MFNVRTERFTEEYEAYIRSIVNHLYVDQRGTESYERAVLLAEIDLLRTQIKQSIQNNFIAGFLCAGGDIDEAKEQGKQFVQYCGYNNS
jgi:hypothetical protein